MWHTATTLPISNLEISFRSEAQGVELRNLEDNKRKSLHALGKVMVNKGSVQSRRLLVLCWLHSSSIWLWKCHQVTINHIKKTFDQGSHIAKEMRTWPPLIKQHRNLCLSIQVESYRRIVIYGKLPFQSHFGSWELRQGNGEWSLYL